MRNILPCSLCLNDRTSHTTADPISLINSIHERKMKAGVAISPDTPSTAITDEIGEAADMLLVMTVYPGARSPFNADMISAHGPPAVQVAAARNSWNAVCPR